MEIFKFKNSQKLSAKGLTLMISSLIISSGINAQCIEGDYKFSGNAQDLSGNGYHATVNGATLTSDRFGSPNSAYEFDGTNDYIDTQTSFDFEERTISVWCYPYDTVNRRKVLDMDDIGLLYGSITVSFQTGGLFGNPGGAGTNLVYANPPLNQWYHVVLVREAATSSVYVNGNLVYTGAPTSNGSSISPNPNLVIGTHRTLSQDFFEGKIDDLQIFSCALTPSQIDSIYLGYEDYENVSVKFYPNPMTDVATLEIDNPSNIQHSLNITNINGQVVKTIDRLNNNKVVIDKQEMSNGIYFYQLISEEGISATGKFIVQ